MRVISAEEYDAATLRTPKSCPLFVMGDARSGALLLEGMDQDLRLCSLRVADLGVTVPGQQFQNLLVHLLCGQCLRLLFEA